VPALSVDTGSHERQRTCSTFSYFGQTLLRRDKQLLIEGREATGDHRPGIAAAFDARAAAEFAPLLRIARGTNEDVDERPSSSGRMSQPVLPSGDDCRRAVRLTRDHG